MASLTTTTSCTSTTTTTTFTSLADNETANVETMAAHTVVEPSIAPKNLLKSDAVLEELQKQPYFHGSIKKEAAEHLLVEDGRYLIRFAKDKTDGLVKTVISLRWSGKHYHFLIREKFGLFSVEEAQFESIDSLLQFHERTKKPLTRKSGAVVVGPILRKSALRDGKTLIPLLFKIFVIAIVALALYGSVLMKPSNE